MADEVSGRAAAEILSRAEAASADGIVISGLVVAEVMGNDTLAEAFREAAMKPYHIAVAAEAMDMPFAPFGADSAEGGLNGTSGDVP